MRTASDPGTEKREHHADSEAICPRCHTASPAGTIECPACGRHFFVYCGACGHLNPREAIRCDACAHQLRVRRGSRCSPAIHRLVWPVRWDWHQQPRWVLPGQILASMVAVFLGMQAILFLHERYAAPRPPAPGSETELEVLPDGQIVELPPGTSFGTHDRK